MSDVDLQRMSRDTEMSKHKFRAQKNKKISVKHET